MKKLFFLILMAATCVSIAATAQYAANDRYGNDRYNNSKTGQNSKYGRSDDNYGRSRSDNSMINALQREVREDIAEGIIRGTIDSREAQRLLSIAEQIELKENRYVRNGRLTQRESEDIKEDLMSLKRMIRKEKTDRDMAPVDNGRYDNRYGGSKGYPNH